MATSRIVLDDFSGGIEESASPSDFTARQWTSLKGFILTSDNELQSQWECQRVSTASGFKYVRAFMSGNTRYLVALKGDGSLWYATPPARLASATVAAATTWTQLMSGTDPTGATVALSTALSLRFLTEMQFLHSSRYMNGLLLHTTDRSTTQAILLYESAANTLSAKVYTNFYPTTTLVNPVTGLVDADTSLNTFEVGNPNTIPRANVGCIWGNFLVLGDVEWGSTFPLTSANTKPYRNGLWISSVDAAGVPAPDRFLPQASLNLVGTPDSVIRGLQVTDRGLLVFTTSATNGDGVILLRGTPPTGDGTVTYVQEVLRGGMGVPENTLGEHSLSHGVWPDAGATVFLEATGTVWHTNGTEVGRLDAYGPTPPSFGLSIDSVAGIGPYLFVARNLGTPRLLCMRKFEEDGAWTELVTPFPSDAVWSLTTVQDDLYFVQAGQVFRFMVGGGAHGLVNGTYPELTVTSAPQNLQGLEHDTKHWFRIGVRARGLAAGYLQSIKSMPQSPLVASDGYLHTLTDNLEGRAEVAVHGHGPSVECTVQLKFTGNVAVESVTLWVTGKEPSR
jgi:hypothetical protein